MPFGPLTKRWWPYMYSSMPSNCHTGAGRMMSQSSAVGWFRCHWKPQLNSVDAMPAKRLFTFEWLLA